MAFDAFKCFIGREEVAEAFDHLVSAESGHRPLLVSGLSGTGKSLVIDWLRRFRCKGISTAKLTLAPAFQETDLLRSLALQLDPPTGHVFGRRLDELTEQERQHPLFHVPVNQSVEGRLGGSVSDADQRVVVNLGEAGALIELQRRTQRMDALISWLNSVDVKPWVLFLDETEHLTQPDLRRFILDDLVPRLRSRCNFSRLYFSGQSVPLEAFSRHEIEHLQLSEFDVNQTRSMAAKAGLNDPKIAERLFEFTGGHPLLLSMWIEDVLDREGAASDKQMEEPSPATDEAERTRWIYDRIVRRFSDATARKIAANLSLLEWFDLGLLRSIFDPTFSEEAFRQMVSRSFIKPLGKSRWRCHDMIRKHLPAQRRSVDPAECAEVCRRAADAFVERLTREEERAGQTEFPERLAFTTAAIQSMLGFSLKRAEEFVQQEIARSTAAGATDYLFAIARHLELSPEAEPFRELAGENKDILGVTGRQPL